MSLNTVHLTPALLTELFGNVLVDPGTASADSKPYKYIGSNKKNILIITAKSALAFLEDEELSFLTTVLSACNLTLADVALVNHNNLPDETGYKQLVSFFESRVILLFDLSPERIGLPFHFPEFQIQQFDGRTYVSAPALMKIKKDKALKGLLWNTLKNMFGI